MEGVEKDSRFSHIVKDPRFHKMPRKERKVKIDKRFHGMFKDKKFKLKYAVDKRGRPLNLTTNEHLRRYYDLSDSEESSSDENKVKGKAADEIEEKNNDRVKQPDDGSKSVDKLKTRKDRTVESVKNDKLTVTKIKDKKQRDDSKPVKTLKAENNSKLENSRQDTEKLNRKKTKNEKRNEKEDVNNGNVQTMKIDNDSDGDDEDESVTDHDDEGDHSSGSEEELKGDIDFTPGEGPDYARGEGLDSNSDEDTDFDIEQEEEEFSDSHWGEIDKDAPTTEEITNRLAICNMDWDRIKAQDIFVLLNSFKPPGGVVKSVKIYPSEFGLKRMAEEQMKGPQELVQVTVESDGEEGTDEKYHREKLRRYQLNRLKYYYAVAEFDSRETANHVYEQTDGQEYESSSTKIDLRFIPTDMEFVHEPKSVATDMPEQSSYNPSLFVTSALNQSKVELTWDEDDRDRMAVTRRKFNKEELRDLDVKDYLASSSGSESEDDPYGGLVDFGSDHREVAESSSDDEKAIEKYRKLLQGTGDTDSKNEDKEMEMEITWEPGLKETTESIIKKTAHKKEKMSPWEQYVETKKEKKKQKRTAAKEEKLKKKLENETYQPGGNEGDSEDEVPAGIDLNDPYFKEELDKMKQPRKKKYKNKPQLVEETEEDKQKKAELTLLMNDDDDDKQHFNLKSIMESEKPKKKKKKKVISDSGDNVQDGFQVDVSDPRFEALYTSHLYNIDPSSSDFKKTKAMETIIHEKSKRRQTVPKGKLQAEEPVQKLAKVHKNEFKTDKIEAAALSSLVKSVKAKTKFYNEKKSKAKILNVFV